MSRTSNLRGAPLFLRPSVVRALVEDVHVIAQAVTQVPLMAEKLVDIPRRSEDPRLAKANDDDFSRLPVKESGRKRKAERGEVSLIPQAISGSEFETKVGPETLETSPIPIPESAATRLSREDRAGLPAQAPEGSSGGVDGGASSIPANACEQRTKPASSGSPRPEEAAPVPSTAKLSGFERMPSRSSAAPSSIPAERSMRLPPPIKTPEARQRATQPVAAEPFAGPDRIRAMATKLAARRAATAQLDPARFAAAFARQSAEKSRSVPAKAKPLEPARSREECPRCGIPGWKGCTHFLPFAEQPVVIGADYSAAGHDFSVEAIMDGGRMVDFNVITRDTRRA